MAVILKACQHISDLILRSGLLAASRRMAASPCVASILRDPRPDSASALPGGRAPQDEASSYSSALGLFRLVLNRFPCAAQCIRVRHARAEAQGRAWRFCPAMTKKSVNRAGKCSSLVTRGQHLRRAMDERAPFNRAAYNHLAPAVNRIRSSVYSISLHAWTLYGTCTTYRAGWLVRLPARSRWFFYRTPGGAQLVRDWLRSLEERDRSAVGLDLMRVQFR